jgi:hypothetical protein
MKKDSLYLCDFTQGINITYKFINTKRSLNPQTRLTKQQYYSKLHKIRGINYFQLRAKKEYLHTEYTILTIICIQNCPSLCYKHKTWTNK